MTVYMKTCQIFREHTFYLWYICVFVGYRIILYINDSSLLWELGVHVILILTRVYYETL